MFIPERLSVKTAIKLRAQNFIKKIFKIWNRESYSQLGEDIAIKHIFENELNIKNGCYIDVGCNHPIIFSNTFGLYLEGWKGITVDFNKDLIDLHHTERKQDIQINTAISDKKESVVVYEFESSLIRTINEKFYAEHKEDHKLISEDKTIETATLNQIIEENNLYHIDLLCIDVEGHDFKVLQSINLNKYRPKLIVIEMHGFNFEKLTENEIYAFLKNNNYKFIGYLIANGYFIDSAI